MKESVESASTTPAASPEHGSARLPLVCAVLVVLGVALYLPGLRWGLPATQSWSQDTIAGVRTLGASETWPEAWGGRYAPLHYLVLRACYEPYLRYLVRTGQGQRDPATGQVRFQPPHEQKIGVLLLIARVVSALMAIGAGVSLCVGANRWLGVDPVGAGIAGATLMISPAFSYFARLGNVDVPAMFWFSVSVVFYARLLRSMSVTDAVLLGLCGSLAISTKDSTAGVYPGMALVLWGTETAHTRGGASWFVGAVRALCRRHWLLGLLAFALPYLFLNGVFHNPDAYVERMKYWLGITPGTIHLRQHRYANQWALCGATLYYAAGAVGWSLLALMIGSILHGLRRHRRLSIVLLVPCVTYYVIIIVPQGFVYSRFLFPPLAMIGVLTGVACVDLWRSTCCACVLRVGVLGAVVALTLGYTSALTCEMVSDSRYRAERWFTAHVPTSQSIGAFSKPQYLPRLNELGYRTYLVEMSREAFTRTQPDCLILTSYNYEDFDPEPQSCLRDLLDGKLGYQVEATFGGRFLEPGQAWWGVGGWWSPTPGKISPKLTVLIRTPAS